MEEEEIIYFNHLDFRDTMKKPIKICVTGGKGGTGKTLVAINLAVMFRDNGKKILLLDGDVENPNTYLLLGTDLEDGKNVHFFIPKVNEDKCTKCGLCAKNCASNAILFVKDAYPIIIPLLPIVEISFSYFVKDLSIAQLRNYSMDEASCKKSVFCPAQKLA